MVDYQPEECLSGKELDVITDALRFVAFEVKYKRPDLSPTYYDVDTLEALADWFHHHYREGMKLCASKRK